MGFIALIAGMLLVMLADHWLRPSTVLRSVFSLSGYAFAIWVAWRSGIADARKHDVAVVARSMEAAGPQLHEQVVSAVELDDANSPNGSVDFRGRLQTVVARQLSGLDVRRLLPWKLVRRAVMAAVGVAAIIAAVGMIPSLQLHRRMARAFLPIAPIERASLTRIEILRPDPASDVVAEGDLVAVVASVGRLGAGQVTLEWKSDDGAEGSMIMSRRDLGQTDSTGRDKDESEAGSKETGGEQLVGSSTDDETFLQSYRTFAVNAQVHSHPLHYRVLAGDAETLWHTLTPKSRPRVESFRKKYQFPLYAKLPTLEEVDSFGDLSALVGTQVSVDVKFDQPVANAIATFDSRGVGVPLTKIENDPTRFTLTVPIRTAGSYRVDATSIESELNNPFTPRYTIDPILDRTPLAAWDTTLPRRQIVSPAAVISLAGVVEDDLPMDEVIQQIAIDGEKIIERRIPLNRSQDNDSSDDPKKTTSTSQVQWTDDGARAAIGFQWDLVDWAGTGLQANPLSSGTQLRTRLVALDRAGHRGVSDWIDVLVAGETFDADRHATLFAQQALTREIAQWWATSHELAEAMQEASKTAKQDAGQEAFAPDPEFATKIADLREQWKQILAIEDLAKAESQPGEESDAPSTLAQWITQASDSVRVDQWTLLDRVAHRSLDTLSQNLSLWEHAAETLDRNRDKRERERVVSAATGLFHDIASLAKRAQRFVGWTLSVETAAATMRDLAAIESNGKLLSDENNGVPILRLPGQGELLTEQLRQVSGLLETLAPDLHEDTVHHHERLHRFLDDKTTRLSDALKKLVESQEENPDIPVRGLFEQLTNEMPHHRIQSLLHGNTYNEIASTVKDFTQEKRTTKGALVSLERVWRTWEDSQRKMDASREMKDSDQIAKTQALEAIASKDSSPNVTTLSNNSNTMKR